MQINDLIQKLQEIQREHGNIEVTCTATTDGDSTDPTPQITGGAFESSVENLQIVEGTNKWNHGKRVRIGW